MEKAVARGSFFPVIPVCSGTGVGTVELLEVDPVAWKGEVELISNHYDFIGERLPQPMRDELSAMEARLNG